MSSSLPYLTFPSPNTRLLMAFVLAELEQPNPSPYLQEGNWGYKQLSKKQVEQSYSQPPR